MAKKKTAKDGKLFKKLSPCQRGSTLKGGGGIEIEKFKFSER